LRENEQDLKNKAKIRSKAFDIKKVAEKYLEYVLEIDSQIKDEKAI